jgi:hypothetical protein
MYNDDLQHIDPLSDETCNGDKSKTIWIRVYFSLIQLKTFLDLHPMQKHISQLKVQHQLVLQHVRLIQTNLQENF